MQPLSTASDSPHARAALLQTGDGRLALAGHWTALHLGDMAARITRLPAPAATQVVADGSGLQALDTVGAWTLRHLLQHLHTRGASVSLQGLAPHWQRVWEQLPAAAPQDPAPPAPAPHGLARLGRQAVGLAGAAATWLSFVGQVAAAALRCLQRPARIRWRPILYNIRSAGVDALPIVGLLSFLLGIVVAYQAAAQLQRFGANILVADLVGLSMLREFAPLMTAIIVAGRSGSAYAAQIGTMAVTEEIDAMRTMAIPPLEMLVLPKLAALVLALPLLTVFADMLGTLGGMVMAQAVLGVGYADFLDRFARAVNISSLLVGIGKAPVFAALIVIVGCFQGLATRGGADAVGRQTTRAVVQSIFLVIVADALFSVVFSILEL